MEDSKKHNEIELLLSEHGIRPTASRLLIVRALAEATNPLSAQEIESMLETVDRSSITRTLATLLESHMLHRISDGSGSERYELCRDHYKNEEHSHRDEHAHFHCRKCGATICLPDIKLTAPTLPEGCIAENSCYVISGLCSNCARNR